MRTILRRFKRWLCDDGLNHDNEAEFAEESSEALERMLCRAEDDFWRNNSLRRRAS